MSLADVLPIVQQLPPLDKLRLIRLLAEALDTNQAVYPFEADKVYSLPTPYNTYGAGDILMKALASEPPPANG